MNGKTGKESQGNRAEKESVQPPKDSTGEIPMFDLQEAITLVVNIQEKRLEMVPMPQVAKGVGYASPSSTPFYRRFVAARLFGLLSTSRAELTTRAKDYMKPDSEDAKGRSLCDAVMGIPYYAETISKFQGKKLNVDLVANGIAKTFTVTEACAKACARAFAGSIKFAGMLSPDGVVTPTSAALPEQPRVVPSPESQPIQLDEGTKDMQQHTLFLDKGKTRKLVLSGPITITRAEYERICKWLEVAMIVEDAKETPQSANQ